VAAHRLVLQGNGKLAIVDANGNYEWEMPWDGIHDIHVLDSGNLMVQQQSHKVVEIDRAGKLQKQVQRKRNHPDAHSDTRLVRKLENGNYLVCHEADGFVRA
jgi:hypothetical protein